MKNLNAIVYYSKEDKCFISHSVECDQLGTGQTKEEAIRDLGNALRQCYNACVSDNTLIFYRDAPKSILESLEKAIKDQVSYPLKISTVPGYFKINNYDFSNEDINV
jgi:hypothetical protein